MEKSDSGLIRLEAHLAKRTRRDSEVRLKQDPYASLVSAAQTGDREALGQLLRVLAPRLRGAARALFGGEHPDLDDVVQDALIAVVKALPAFAGRSTVIHYAYRITVRVALAGKRKSQERVSRYEPVADLDHLEEDGREDLLATERRNAVRGLLDALPENQAETMALRVCLGMSLAEVSAATDAPVNTVRSRLRLARGAMRRRIEADATLSELLEGWL